MQYAMILSDIILYETYWLLILFHEQLKLIISNILKL